MIDMSQTVAPKSDQLNTDDLIAGPRTITVRAVKASGTPEQPISIFFEGDGNKPYKPCKSMRRVLIQVWGNDGAAYVGRSMTLYCDPDVVFGGIKVGGIRISHMTGINQPITMALTASKAQRKPFQVKPLAVSVPASWTEIDALDAIEAAEDNDSLRAALARAWKSIADDDARTRIKAAYDRRRDTLDGVGIAPADTEAGLFEPVPA